MSFIGNVFKKKPWVTASEIATAELCPYQIYLRQSGATVNAKAQINRSYGNQMHEKYNESKKIQRRDKHWLKLVFIDAALLLTLLIGFILLAYYLTHK